MKNRYFYDEASDFIISFEDVKSLYNEAVANLFTNEDFSTWFQLVQSYNNGTLTEVYKFSMTVWIEEKERYEDIVAIGSNADNACKRYGVDNNLSEYPIVISSRKIDF